MTNTIILKDNSDNTLSKKDFNAFLSLADRTLSEIKAQNGAGIFVFSGNSKDEIEKLTLFHKVKEENDNITLKTTNLMGFIGLKEDKKDINIKITSRFCQGENKDYFLYYMLSKVCHFNFVDFPVNKANTNWINLLPLLFPHSLKKALRQGLYKQYITKKYNDINLKGRINIAEHLKKNIPFMGKFRYDTREYSFDNPLTQLIRHTIEHIKNLSVFNNVLNSAPDEVKTIILATPSYNKAERSKVINQNLRPLKMPYFTEYLPLRKLCLKILLGGKIAYGADSSKIYGVLFDGAWLWEEYLNKVFKEDKDDTFKNLIHAENKTGKKPLYLFKSNKSECYPDFYQEKDTPPFIADAKYKWYKDYNKEDLYQLITYMYITKAEKGLFLVPGDENQTQQQDEQTIEQQQTLNGYGGEIAVARLYITQNNDGFDNFEKQIKTNEEKFITAVAKFWKQATNFK